MMEKLKAKKKDNKGFSLVELIIVIAIMAILVGIVGTQVVPYIERSRKAKDIQQISGFCTDAMTAYSSNASKLDATETYTITIDSTGVTAVDSTGAASSELKSSFTELNSISNISSIKFESKSGKAITSITITCQNAKPMISLVVAGPSDAADFKVESK
ncbi:MAG: type II secretion system protein [Roseburia sp.]|nr:type II secretion system protein [Roseburia sp.]